MITGLEARRSPAYSPDRSLAIPARPARLAGPLKLPETASDAVRFAGGNPLEPPQSLLALPDGPDYSNRPLSEQDRHAITRAPDLKKARFINCDMPGWHLDGKKLHGAVFDGVDLRDGQMILSVLEDARFCPTARRKANLSNCYMDGSKISRADFTQAILHKAMLTRTTGTGPVFRKADLSEANLTDAILLKANFDGADLTMADVRGATLNDADLALNWLTRTRDIYGFAASFKGARLVGADFTGSNLIGADFGSAVFSTDTPGSVPAMLLNTQMQYARLKNARMPGMTFVKTRLQGADFTKLGNDDYLNHAVFKSAVLDGANFKGLKLRDVNFTQAILTGAHLEDADLRGLSFNSARLQGAHLRDAGLQGAILKGARLQGTDLRGAKLQGADLRDISVDNRTNWTGATYNRYTKFPKDVHIPLDEMVFEPTLLDKIGLSKTDKKKADPPSDPGPDPQTS